MSYAGMHALCKRNAHNHLAITTFMNIKLFGLIALIATLLSSDATAVTFIVPGTSDPWLAAQPNGTTASLGDVAPAQSPVFAGLVTPGLQISWTASGLVSFGPGEPSGGPDGVGSPIMHTTGAENGIADINAPVNSLLGIFYGGGMGTPFLMGSSGNIIVPSGVTQLYLGTMDGFGWSNNIGSFTVDVTFSQGVPEAGSTLFLLGLATGALSIAKRRINRC
jgi:hypothetical protein